MEGSTFPAQFWTATYAIRALFVALSASDSNASHIEQWQFPGTSRNQHAKPENDFFFRFRGHAFKALGQGHSFRVGVDGVQENVACEQEGRRLNALTYEKGGL